MINIENIQELYEVTLPYFDSNEVKNFNFNTKLNGNTFNFNFFYAVDHWIGWATLPDGTIRHIGIFPNILNWSRFRDYSLAIISNAPQITLEELVNCKLWIFEW